MTEPEPRVRQMHVVDLPTVMAVDGESFQQPWSETLWRQELSSPFSLYLILEENEGVCGHIGVKIVADELHIMRLAVRPERRRRGFARALVRTALADPASAGARRAYLEVRPSSLAARTLYGSLGFVETGVRPGYYGYEDALLMTLDLREWRTP